MPTCTAPGHPSCKITCPKGCGAIWSAKYGCRTICTGKAADARPFEFEEDDTFSVQISEFPANELGAMLGKALVGDLHDKASSSEKTISQSVKLAQYTM
jgi:hypothetical protein